MLARDRVKLAREASPAMTIRHFKACVAENFSRHVATYDGHAEEQRAGAKALAEYAAQCAEGLVAGPLLEIGCGTGFLSVELATLFPDRELELTDLSPEMVANCRQKIAAAGIEYSNIRYGILDGEQLECEDRYALIGASFAVHWFADIATGLRRLLRALKPGGHLLCAYPGAGSYREWHSECARQNIPCSANPLPDPTSVAGVFADQPVKLRQWERELVMRFSSARDFLRHLKRTGAGTPTRADAAALGPAQLRQLLRGWDRACPDGVEITCAIHYLAVVKEG